MTAFSARVRGRAARWLAVVGLWRHVPRGVLAVALLLNVLLGLLPVGFVVATSVLLDRVPEAFGPGGEVAPDAWSQVLPVLGVAGLVFGAQQSLTPFQEALGELVSRRVDLRCRGELVRAALTEAPARALEDPRLLDQLDVAREALDRSAASPGDAAAGTVALVARYTQLVGATALVGFALSPLAAAVIGLTALAIRFGHRGSLGAFADFYDGLAPEKRKVTYLRRFASGAQAAKEIRLLRLVDWARARYRAEHTAYFAAMWRGRRRLLGPPFLLLSAVGLTGAATVLTLLAVEAARGGLGLLELGLAAQSTLILVRFGVHFPECDMQTQYGTIAHQALRAFRDGARTMTGEPTGGATGGPTSGPTGRPMGGPTGGALPDGGVLPRHGIRFDDVGFRYRPGGRPVLDGLSLDLPAGTSTAVVGLNGAGKTTLVKLLTRLYDPTAGRITVDGRDLAELDPAAWHRRLAVIFQDFVRYELSAADNIALGAPWAPVGDDATLLAAAGRAGASDVVEALPEGLRTVLSRQYRGGRDLSGGQWQRVALARALLAVHAGASVMVLDEPTAQLDVRAEVAFFDRFLDITRGLTTVIVSHRFSTVRRADQIVVLDRGRVAERGTHDELMAAGGQYARLFRVQADRFDEAESVETSEEPWRPATPAPAGEG
ncbi:ABC transporter ATP-binding protein [Streptomyces sp. 4N509B]|uniref:ABC transporter ATP-binding protein n=1 Tax=Streptomyces sp. 4N509B TaxID=3457413 RepID=UPI003FD1C145